MQRVRIGLAGAGLNGGVHSLMLQQIAERWSDRVELVGVADPLRAVAERFVAQYGYRYACADPFDLIARGDIDALFVCAPTRFHAPIVNAAAAAGVHVFCEKPLAMNAGEAEEMLAAARRAGIRAQIGLVLRFSPVYAVMADLLRRPEAAEPMAVVLRDDQCFPIRGLHDTPWRKDPAVTAGGTLIEHGVHDLDLMVWMFGPIARLRAWERNHAGHAGIEDYMAVEIELRSGLRAQLVNIWHDMEQRPSNRRLEIFCRRAFIASEHDMLGEIFVQCGDDAGQVIGPEEVLRRFRTLRALDDAAFESCYSIPYFVQDLSFVRALLEERDPEPGLEVGVAAQHLAEAVYTAARTGSELEVGTST